MSLWIWSENGKQELWSPALEVILSIMSRSYVGLLSIYLHQILSLPLWWLEWEWPHRFINLKVWPPVNLNVWEWLGEVLLLEMFHWGGLCVFKRDIIPSVPLWFLIADKGVSLIYCSSAVSACLLTGSPPWWKYTLTLCNCEPELSIFYSCLGRGLLLG